MLRLEPINYGRDSLLHSCCFGRGLQNWMGAERGNRQGFLCEEGKIALELLLRDLQAQ